MKKYGEEIMNDWDFTLITHKNCADGTGSAVVFDKWFKERYGNTKYRIEFMQYNDDIPWNNIIGKHVMMADFSFSKEILEEMKEKTLSLQVIDHHATAEEALKDLEYCIFDMKESGASLLWKFLFPNEAIPPLIQYIKDRDIWTWLLPDSEAVSAALMLKNKYKIEEWSPYLYDVSSLIEEGKTILKYQQQSLDKTQWAYGKGKVDRINIAGHNVPFMNVNHLISEVGNLISEQNEPFAIMYFFTNDSIVFSYRSSDDSDKTVDVSQLAKSYGGGGHPRAAGSSWKFDNINLTTLFRDKDLDKALI